MIKNQNKPATNIEIGTLVENFDDKITFIAEQVVAIKETQDKHGKILNQHSQQLDRIEMGLDNTEETKADKKEVAKLSQRVVALETKI